MLLPGRRGVEHHTALPYSDMPAFMAELRTRDAVGARALEFLALTAVRTSEALGARWDEISGNVWTIPASRMKSGREHRVPLSRRAVEILAAMPRISDFVFAIRGGRPLGDDALSNTLRRMGRKRDTTVHGLRSTFRDWAAERTNYANHVVEMALAHAVGNQVEAAYRRGDLFEKRARLMNEWATYCSSPATTSDIIPLRGRE